MWSRRFDCCKKCGTTDRPHGGLGFCNRCYQTRNSTGKINRNRRFSVDDYLFHGEWTEKSSYLYGVLYSDGNISKTAHKICIGLSVRDLEWLESLKLLFDTEVKLCISEMSLEGLSITFRRIERPVLSDFGPIIIALMQLSCGG